MLISTNFNFQGNQIQNASLHPVGTAPSTPTIGQIYTDTSGSTHAVKMWLNVSSTAQWVTLSTSANSFTNPMTTLGDIMYGGSGGTATRLAGNTTTTPQFLTSTGSAGLATAPTWTGSTGSGNIVLATSPSLTTPTLGVATATSVNKVTITQPATGSTLTVQEGFTLTANGNATVSGTNTGDVTLAANSGLAFTSGQTGLYVGTPSSITTASTNSVTTNTHTHAITGFIQQAGSTNFTGGTTNVASGAILNVQSGGSLTIASGATFQTSTTPSNATDVVNKQYVDNIAVGLTDWKSSVRVATTGNITLSGGAPTVVDTITLVANDRVLVKSQTTPAENGIYYVSTLGSGANGTWTRATDADTSAEVTSGMYVFVEEGSATNKGQYVLNTANPITLGTTGLTFVRFNGASTLTQGNGITISGDTISQTSRTINGTSYDGSANITVPVNSTDDTATNATMYPLWVTGTGNIAPKISTTKLSFNPSTGVLTSTGFSGSGASLTSLTAGNLSGTIPSAVLGNSTVYIGTTAVALNRASASLALTGITSIDGTTFTGAVSLNASLGIAIADGAPGVTTNKLYNVGGSLYFNGATVGSVKKYTTTITGSGPTFNIDHNLNTKDVSVVVYDASDNAYMVDWTTSTVNRVVLTFGYGVPGAATHRVVVIG